MIDGTFPSLYHHHRNSMNQNKIKHNTVLRRYAQYVTIKSTI